MDAGRRTSLGHAAAAVRSGESVDVVGSHGSGRSAFLKDLADLLSAEGWSTVFLHGIASLKAFPLAALQIKGIVDPEAEMHGIASAQLVSAAVQAKTAGPRSVLFLDDWDDLDEASWGVIDSNRRAHGVPVVLSRRYGSGGQQSGRGSYASPLTSAYVIELLPLRIHELEAVLKAHLDAPIERGTLNRIYAKTGGHLGLTLALVNAALREGHLVRDGYGVWVSTGELWSLGLRSVLEIQLENLPPSARDSLEILAAVGAVDVETARRLLDTEALELLEERGLVALSASPARDLVTVVPPLLVEYFRHEPVTARKNRLHDLILDRIGDVESVTTVLADRSRPTPAAEGRDALFAGLVNEQARTRALVASAEWQAAPTPLNAARYVVALMQSSSPAVEETVEQVFAATDRSVGDLESRAELVALQANWLAHVKGQLAEALALLRAERPLLERSGRLLDAAEVTILTDLVGVPDDVADKLEITEDLSPKVQLALLEAQLLVLVSSCRFSEAHRVFERIRSLDPGEERVEPRVLFGFALLGEGRHAEALRLLTSWFEEARGALDLQAFRAFGGGLALCHTHSGDHVALDRLADLMFAAGEPTPFPSNSQVALLSVTTNVVAARRGDSVLVERWVAQARDRGLVDGPLPAQTLAWPISQLLILDGNPAKASDELWRSGEALWARSAYYAGILEMLVSIEINPDAERLEQVQHRLALIPEDVAAQAQGRYITALLERDLEAMLASAEALANTGRFGMAVAAAQLAEAWFEGAASPERAAQARALGVQVRSRISTTDLDVARFAAAPAMLSDREEQVARLAAAGHTNKEIATRLFLSVRTVDSHMRRILRKLQLTNRRELGDYFGDR